MKIVLAVAAALLLSDAARAESLAVLVQETVVVEISGATAAYTINPAIADVTIIGAGRVSVTGHSAGTTQLMVITVAGTQSFLITVGARALPLNAGPAMGTPLARYDGRYSSGAARVQTGVDIVTTDQERRSEFHILHVRQLRTEQRADSIASIFYRHATPRRQLTLFDEIVDVSRMTISNTQLRGVHLQQGPLELHGGYASSSLYDGFFLQADRRWAAGAGYTVDRASVRWTPSVYGFFSERAGSGARRGVVGALTAEHRRGDVLFMRAELGLSRSVAAAGELRYTTSRNQLRAFLSVKPADFPTLGLSDLPGEHAELNWNRRATPRLSITTQGAYDRFNLAQECGGHAAALECGGHAAAGPRETIGTANLGFRYGLTQRLAITGGADASSVRTASVSVRTIGVPLGVTYEASAFGFGASYRLLDHSLASRRGDAIRLNAHTGLGRFTASVWTERQRNAPTLDLIFSSQPDLELALLRLGISVRTPEDVARALRDNAALIDLGFITGVNVDLTPRRLQAGLNLGWTGSGPRSDHLRLAAVFGRDEGIRTTRDNMLATLTYSRRVLSATDLYGSLTWWRAGLHEQQQMGTSVELGLRQQFSGLPAFLRRSGTVEGFAFLDPEMRGVRGSTTAPLPQIDVTLDGSRTTKTDAIGAYAFKNVRPGLHKITARLPASPRAFFTTPSHAELTGPAHIDFGMVWAAARIDGRVTNDAGAGIAGVALSAAVMDGVPIGATSDADGRFVFAVPPGTFRIGLSTASLPPGYSIAGENERKVKVEPDEPGVVSFAVQALRSVAGRAAGASEVRIESLDRTARVDAAGNFVFRSMPSGKFTIAARIGGRTVSTVVTLPSEPTILRDIVLGAPPAS